MIYQVLNKLCNVNMDDDVFVLEEGTEPRKNFLNETKIYKNKMGIPILQNKAPS